MATNTAVWNATPPVPDDVLILHCTAGWCKKPCARPSTANTAKGPRSRADISTEPSPTAGAPRRFQRQHTATTASDQRYPLHPVVRAGANLPRYKTKMEGYRAMSKMLAESESQLSWNPQDGPSARRTHT